MNQSKEIIRKEFVQRELYQLREKLEFKAEKTEEKYKYTYHNESFDKENINKTVLDLLSIYDKIKALNYALILIDENYENKIQINHSNTNIDNE